MTGGLGTDSLILKLPLLNARSVNNKTYVKLESILNEDTNLVCILETWLDEGGRSRFLTPFSIRFLGAVAATIA